MACGNRGMARAWARSHRAGAALEGRSGRARGSFAVRARRSSGRSRVQPLGHERGASVHALRVLRPRLGASVPRFEGDGFRFERTARACHFGVRQRLHDGRGPSKFHSGPGRLRHRRWEKALKHFLLMLLFASLVAVVFGIVGREGDRGRVRYAFKIFLEFVVVGFVLAWLLYWIPW